MTFTIRRAVAADAVGPCDTVRHSISELCVEDHHDNGPTLTASLANKIEANFTRWITSDQHVAFVAEKAGPVVGFGLLNRGGSIALLYVSPDVRFRGVSKALLAAMEDAARSTGVRARGRMRAAIREQARDRRRAPSGHTKSTLRSGDGLPRAVAQRVSAFSR